MCELLAEFEVEWFATPRWWFHPMPEDDVYIARRYTSLLETVNYTMYDFSQLHINHQVALIVVHDQLPRHVYRNDPDKEKIVTNHALFAIAYANHVQNALESLSSEQATFVLLPYRHTNQHRCVFYAINRAWDLLKQRGNSDKRLKRFLKAAYSRAPMDQSQLIKVALPPQEIELITPAEFFERFKDVICHSSCHERHLLPPHGILSSIGEQLKKYGLINKSLVVSLSGGVDSMVLCYALVRHFDNDVVAVHIDYANRDTSEREALFVQQWCSALDIKCVVRRLSEIHRPTCMEYGMRSVYESYTRNVRMNTYKAAAPLNPQPIVCMGHNFNDSFENIVTNIASHTKYDNLLGMDEFGAQGGLTFWRPLLGVTKEQIYQYAHAAGIPYLYDSTVSWSHRGKIRDSIYPAIAGWNPSSFAGFYDLSKHLTDMHGILHSLVDSYVDQYSQTSTIRMPTTFSALTNHLFWRHLVHRVQKVHLSHSSLANFINRIMRVTACPETITTRTKVMLNKMLVSLLIKKKSDPKHVMITFNAVS